MIILVKWFLRFGYVILDKQRMGCVNSRADINDLHPNVFQVMNVDDSGNLITPGRLEVTGTDIILYQRRKQPIKWSLRCLRRYGYDAEVFSFESGRRCSTGPGIYAFKCRRAEQLFNLVQTNIQLCNNSGDDTLSRDLSVTSYPGAVIRLTIPLEPNYLDPTPIRSNNRHRSLFPRFVHSQQNGIGRLNSIGSSSGPISPQGTMGSPSPPPMLPPPPPISQPISQPHPSSLYVNEEVLASISYPMEMERNNNKSLGRTAPRSSQIATIDNATLASAGFIGDTELISIKHSIEPSNHDTTSLLPMAFYMNVDINSEGSVISPTHSISEATQFKDENNKIVGSAHAYMNISPGQEHIENVAIRVRPPPLPSQSVLQPDTEEGFRHCYANLEASEIENLRKRFSESSMAEKSPLSPSTPTGCAIREVNYAILDLDKKDLPTPSTSDNTTNSASSPPESPNKSQKGYATIDFNKTAALSHSVNPNIVNDNEGSRKTRHNSTINDLATPCRHNLSISE